MCCLLLSLLVMSVVMVNAQTNCSKFATSECISFNEFNIGLNLPPVDNVTESLSNPCIRHKICYDCGARYYVTKTQCDEDVKGTLKEYCSLAEISQIIHDLCMRLIPRYITEVIKPQTKYNPAGNASYCEDPGVEDCLPSTASWA